MDITPIIPEGKNVIKGYGDMAFNISGDVHKNSLIVFVDSLVEWPVITADEISVGSLDAVLQNGGVEILLLGCGDVHVPLPVDVNASFQKANIGVEIMTTGAACRTYNVLLSEGRNVAAALILV